jgi:hypothetical protein
LEEKQVAGFRRLIVVGDLHADLRALGLLLKIVDLAQDGLVFLGDYADRGSFGLEVIEKVSWLAKGNPKNVFLLKGNHEDYSKKGKPNFSPCRLCWEVEKKRGSWQDFFKGEFKEFLERLRLAVVIKGCLLFVHGGVSSRIDGVKKLVNPSREVERDVLWSDPYNGVGERPNMKRGGIGVEFGVDITKKVCEELGVLKIIRSHQPRKARNGPFFEHENRIVTINSTSLYGGAPFVLSVDTSKPTEFEVVRLN